MEHGHCGESERDGICLKVELMEFANGLEVGHRRKRRVQKTPKCMACIASARDLPCVETGRLWGQRVFREKPQSTFA